MRIVLEKIKYIVCVQEAKYLAGDAERKWEEVARKLNMLETDHNKALNKVRQ